MSTKQRVSVRIGTLDISSSEGALRRGNLTAVESVSIRWGRSGVYSQPEPSTCSLSLITTAPGGKAAAAISAIAPGDSLRVNAWLSPRRDITSNALAGIDLPAWIPTGYDGTQRLDVFPWPNQPGTPLTVREAHTYIGPLIPASRWTATARVTAPFGTRLRLSIIQPVTRDNGPLADDALIIPDTDAATRSTVLASTIAQAPTSNAAAPAVDMRVTFRVPSPPPPVLAVRVECLDYRPLRFDAVTPWADIPAHYTWGLSRPRIEALALQSDSPVTVQVPAYTGVVREIEITPRRGANGLRATVHAADIMRDLANRPIGDKPWPQQRLDDRIKRILTLAHHYKSTLAQPILEPVSGSPVIVEPRDVDSQIPLNLIHDYLTACGYIAWIYQDHTGLVLRPQPFDRYAPTIYANAPAPPTTFIKAAHCLGDIVATRDPASTVNSWRFMYEDPETNRRVYYTDSDAAAVQKYGPNLHTLTISEVRPVGGYMQSLIRRYKVASAPDQWRIRAVTYSSKLSNDLGALADLITPGIREGRHITITGIDPRIPVGGTYKGFLDSGEAIFTDGAWNITLQLSAR